MKMNLIRKLYLNIRLKYCDIFNKDFYNKYTTIYKYKNTVGYYKHVLAISKKEAKKIVRKLLYSSDFFDASNCKDIEVIVIKEADNEELY